MKTYQLPGDIVATVYDDGSAKLCHFGTCAFYDRHGDETTLCRRSDLWWIATGTKKPEMPVGPQLEALGYKADPC